MNDRSQDKYEPLIRTGEVARRLGASPEWVRQLVTKEVIPSVRIGNGNRRYLWSDVAAALRLGGSNTQGAP
jgi:excisionase family DNA binding protein